MKIGFASLPESHERSPFGPNTTAINKTEDLHLGTALSRAARAAALKKATPEQLQLLADIDAGINTAIDRAPTTT